jgi:predicted DNA binding CopG/RHH family protein
MATLTKKLYFYHYDLLCNNANVQPIDLNNFINTLQVTGSAHDGIFSHSYTVDNTDYTLDLIHTNNQFSFFRIAKEHDLNSICKRNKIGLQTEEVLSTIEVNSKKIEVLTHFLIDTLNGIIAYVPGQSAPTITEFKFIINHHFINYQMMINNIMQTDSILQLLTPGSEIGNIELDFINPEISFLNDLNLPDSIVQQLAHTEYTKIKITIQSAPRHNLAKGNLVQTIVRSFTSMTQEMKDHLKVKGKEFGKQPKEYAFNEEKFFYNVTFNYSTKENGTNVRLPLAEFSENLYTVIERTYHSNLDEILGLVRNNS